MNLSRVRRLAVPPILIAVAMLGATGIAQAQPKDSCVETVKAEDHAWDIYFLYDNLAKVTPNFSQGLRYQLMADEWFKKANTLSLQAMRAKC